jgi:hypothetical protein
MGPVTLFSSILGIKTKLCRLLFSFYQLQSQTDEKKMFGRVLDLFLRGKLRGVSIERGGLDLDPRIFESKKRFECMPVRAR